MRIGPRVAATEFDDRVYVAHLPDGPIQVLEGTAALIWSYALAVPRSQLAEAVARDVEGDRAEVEAGVVSFVETLIRQGLLVDDEES